MKKILFVLFFSCLVLAGCRQYVYVPVGGNNNQSGTATDYHVDSDGRVWEISYDKASGTFSETETNWYYATPENAQSILDKLKSNENVYFGAGTYNENLEIRHTKEVSTAYKYDYQNMTVIGEEIPLDELPETTVHYVRILENSELRADPSAVFNGEIKILNSHVYGSEGNPVYDAVRNREFERSAFMSHMRMKNIIIDGFSFNGATANDSGKISIDYEYLSSDGKDFIDGLIVRNCSFNGTGTSTADGRAVRMYTGGNDVFRNLEFDNITANTYYQGILVYNANNVKVINCKISNTGHNAIAIQGNGDGFTGEVLIENNILSNITDRAIRFGYGTNAQISLKQNQINNAGDGNSLIKSEALSNCTYEQIGNFYEDNPIADKTVDSVDSISVTKPN